MFCWPSIAPKAGLGSIAVKFAILPERPDRVVKTGKRAEGTEI